MASKSLPQGLAVTLAAVIMGTSICGAQTVTTIELVTWHANAPEIKFTETCFVSAESVKCSGNFAVGTVSGVGEFTGVARGNVWAGTGTSRATSAEPACRYSYEHRAKVVIELRPDGTHQTFSSGGRTVFGSISGPCAAHIPTTTESEPVTTTGTWRILGVSEAPAAAAPAPGSTSGPNTTVVLMPDGKAVTIDLDEWKGGPLTVQQMELARQFEIRPPSGGASYTLQAFRYPGLQGKDPPIFVPMQRLDDTIVDGAQGAAAWAKANPGKASLMALGLAVSIAMPYTAAFQASAGGMTFLESAGIGFMTSATPAAVQTLVTSAASGEGFWKSSGKAAVSGTIAGVESFFGTAVGAGTTGAVETGAALTRRLVGARVSEQAVKGFGAVTSGIAGSATDYGVGILHDKAAEAIAASASKAVIPDLVQPARSTPPGGIVVHFLSP